MMKIKRLVMKIGAGLLRKVAEGHQKREALRISGEIQERNKLSIIRRDQDFLATLNKDRLETAGEETALQDSRDAQLASYARGVDQSEYMQKWWQRAGDGPAIVVEDPTLP